MSKVNSIETLKEKFEANKLQVELFSKESKVEDENNEQIIIDKKYLAVSIPEERDFKKIYIPDDNEIRKVFNSQIEKYRFIKGYEAIWSEKLKCVECEIEAQDVLTTFSKIILFTRLRKILIETESSNKKGDERILFEFPSPKPDLKIFIGESSLDFTILQNFQKKFFNLSSQYRKILTIRIEGKELNTNQEATDFLIKIANSVLFQIDLAMDIPLHLIMDRQIMRDIKERSAKKDKPNFQPPKYEYNKDTLALYWYARTSNNMPLLQFLAFYQVIEFYFPLYSFTEAQKRIKNLFKNPLFDTTKDTDIIQIINIIKVSAKGKSIGDEKSQIKATLQHIIDNESLLNFYNESVERKIFFDQQNKSKGISKQKINFTSVDNDIRIETALRIYEIRCRIVHSKEEDESELLLPYSSEIKKLKHDLELVEFLARQAIIAGARPLTI